MDNLAHACKLYQKPDSLNHKLADALARRAETAHATPQRQETQQIPQTRLDQTGQYQFTF